RRKRHIGIGIRESRVCRCKCRIQCDDLLKVLDGFLGGWHATATHERSGGQVESVGLRVDIVMTPRRRRRPPKSVDDASSDPIADTEDVADVCFDAIVPECDATGRLHKSRVDLKSLS